MRAFSRTVISLVLLCFAAIHYGEPAETDDEAGMSLDEMITNAANSSEEFEFFYDENSKFLKVELDILMSMDQYQRMLVADEEYNNGTRKKRSAGIFYESMRWEHNTVYYVIEPQYTGKEVGVILDSVDEWKKYTCLRFVQSRAAKNKISIRKGGGCSSAIGMSGGQQSMSLGSGCLRKPIVMHEFGHALGMFHEQSRPDRDSYIRVLENNVMPRMLYNFDKKTWATIKNMGIPYDYVSLMHYGKTSFGIGGRTTIQTIDSNYQDRIGQSHGLSFRDIKAVNLMYNCKRHTGGCTKTDNECPGEGFVGKDCTCWCPGGSDTNPIKPCPGGGGRRITTPRPRPVTSRPVTSRPVTARPQTPRPSVCQDDHASCSYWAGKGECSANPGYMLVSCKRSCNKCSGGGVTGGNCKDKHHACAKWKRINYCNGRYKDDIQPLCPKSCGGCRGVGVTTVTKSTCKDEHHACAKWKRINYCNGRYKDIIQPRCKKSCGLCSTGRTPTSSSSSSNTSNSRSKYERRRRCPADQNTTCPYWARIGECAKNPRYMLQKCKMSCNVC